MSFHILNNRNEVVFIYEDGKIKFLDKVLENDVNGGIAVLYHLQDLLGGEKVIDYPPKDTYLFAEAYKNIIFKNELSKHGYVLKETTSHQGGLRV